MRSKAESKQQKKKEVGGFRETRTAEKQTGMPPYERGCLSARARERCVLKRWSPKRERERERSGKRTRRQEEMEEKKKKKVRRTGEGECDGQINARPKQQQQNLREKKKDMKMAERLNTEKKDPQRKKSGVPPCKLVEKQCKKKKNNVLRFTQSIRSQFCSLYRLETRKKKQKRVFSFLSDFLWKQVKEGDESHRSRWTGLGGETKEPKKKKTGKLTVGE